MQKKLKFLASAPLVAGIFVTVYVALGIVYFERQNENQQLTSQIVMMQAALRRPEPDIAAQQAKLAAVNSETANMLGSLPSPEQGIEVYGALIDLAKKNNVEVLTIEASPPVVPKAGTSGSVSLPYSVSLRGSSGDIMDFVYGLAVGENLLQGAEVKGVNIIAAGSADGSSTADVELYVHTWPDVPAATPSAAQVPASKN